MIRKLLATTAIAALLTAPAMAQDAATSGQQMQQPAATQSDSTMSGSAMSGDATRAAASGNYLTNLSSDQYLASNLTGKSLYDGEGEDAQSVGDIQNFLVGSDGKVVAAVVNATVNDESKVVAIPFQQIGWTMGENREPRAVLKASMDELSSAPTFQTMEEQQAAQQQASTDASSAGGTTAPAGNEMAASQPATGTDQSMASSDAGNMAAGKTDREASTGTAGAGSYPATVGSDQYLTENLIGTNVYSGAGDDASDLGGINDLVLASSGQIDAAVVGVGGFLGIGEKDVAVPFGELQMTRDDDAEPRITAALDKDTLEQAPSFDADGDSDQMAANTAQSADQQTANQQSGDQSASAIPGVAAGGAAAGGAAAGSAMSGTASDTEQAANSAGQAMDNAGDQVEQTAENTGQAIGNAADRTQQAAQNTMDTEGDATTTASTGGDQRQGMTRVSDDEQLTADDLMGTTVYGPNDQSVGDIGDIALNADGQVDAVIVDVGGFLGIGEKPVAVGMDNLTFMRDQSGTMYLYTQFTEDQLDNAPEYNKDTYAENRDTMRLQGGATTGSNMSGQTGQTGTQPAN
ncbi:PRC-barrel domain-containing protein [Aurantimonas sp. 22II-16-19i]|uniref:PRC-barrel domain-containing protein n=1 Tax=Aurantimonas sp. 22II-16-19i TaxID=1317114 RepID=UPI0009F7FC18|nr:PRC-barrel domain-containing protein [Aurantimonas sp. 22II-16-19i]ORE98001.1 PRC-barrel domain-containing protein [Aurantimonas sp. 22II-16-19i]